MHSSGTDCVQTVEFVRESSSVQRLPADVVGIANKTNHMPRYPGETTMGWMCERSVNQKKNKKSRADFSIPGIGKNCRSEVNCKSLSIIF